MDNPSWNAGTLLAMSGQFWQSCALHAAINLNLFSGLGDQPSTAGQIASALDLDPRAATMLLNAMAAMGLLVKYQDQYIHTAVSRELLSPESPRYIGFMIKHHHHLVESWSQLDEAVKTGQPVRDRSSISSEERRESFLMGMFNMAMAIVPKVVPHIDLSGRKRLLDLGGGPGTWAIHFCRQNPQLTATVFDLPTTEPFARKTIARFDMSERIGFHGGDFESDEIPPGYDVAWLSHILHAMSPQACQQLVTKTARQLPAGGWILIHEFILNDRMDGPLFPALFSLNMLLGTEAGQAYSQEQISELLQQAGARRVERIPLQLPNDSGIMMGTF